MQTFLPYATFSESAAVLDRQRLGKQRVETLQILQALTGYKVEVPKRAEPTGKKRLAFYGDTDAEVDISGMEQADVNRLRWREVDVLRWVAEEESEWLVEPYVSGGWANHPATRMWRGYEAALVWYQKVICEEWVSRGYKDTCWAKTMAIAEAACINFVNPEPPPWLGSEEFHLSHQSNLVRKDPEFYGGEFNVGPEMEYVWPT